ncbi:MAG: HAD-IIIA family hydrolase [Clostridia bacterium]|nr:HAD-IIIA family hydrolase [Clostridia bacterium]
MQAAWLFFDMGSTIMDESAACEKRIRDSIAGTDITYEQFTEKMAEFARLNLREDLAAVAHFGLKKAPWSKDAEYPYPDADRVLHTLKERGYRLGIIANQLPGSEARLARFGLLPYFDVVCASAEEGVAKPDPEIFLRALSRAGCAPADAVMIGDRTDNDVAPAKALGMQTVLIRQGYAGYHIVHHEGEEPDATVDRLTELLPLFETLTSCGD